MPFRIAARTLLELGAELISSDAVALYELVKNALDAGSPTVSIDVQVVVRRSAYQAALDALSDGASPAEIIRDLRGEILEGAPSDARDRFLDGLVEARGDRVAFRRFLKRLYRRENWIKVSDRGHGMSAAGLSDDFLTIGTRSRRRAKVSRLGRALEEGEGLLGDKGVGRLSVMRLGERLSVLTTTSGERRWNRLEIDWNRFSHSSDAMLEDVAVAPEVGAPKDDLGVQGTTITVWALKADWDAGIFREMVSEQFGRVVDPLPSAPGGRRARDPNDLFEFTFNEDRHEVDGVPRWLLDNAHAHVQARYAVSEDGSARFSGTIDYRLRNKTTSFDLVQAELLSVSDPIADRTIRTTPRTLRDLGPFEVSFWWYNRRILTEVQVGSRSVGRRDVLKEVNAWAGGLMVFRNGFRINPYGSGEDDWLALDRKALGARGYKVNRSQIIGRVALSSRNHRLVEQTNREGLADNDQKRVMVGLLRHLLITEFRNFLDRVDAARRVRETTSTELLEARVRQTRDDTERAISVLIEEAPEQRPRLESLRGLVRQLGELMEQARRLSEEYEDDKAKFTQLAGIGLMVEFILHEIGRTTGRAIEAVGRIDPARLASSEADALRVLRDQLHTLRKRVDNLDPMSTSRRQRKEDLDVGEVVRQVLSGRATQLDRHRIRLVVSGADDPWPTKAIRGMLIGILENLVENAVYWLDVEGRGGARFRPVLRVEVDREVGEVRVADNGPGVDVARAEEIFEPFVTAKPPGQGRGLGLYIARDMAATNGWSLAMSMAEGERRGRLDTFVLTLRQT